MGKCEDEKFNYISIEHHAKCNMRCTYCNDTIMWKLAKYDVQKGLTELVEKNKLRDDLQVAWGGGSLHNKRFKKLIGFVNNSMKPKYNVFSNALIFQRKLQILKKINKLQLVDVGRKTFKK